SRIALDKTFAMIQNIWPHGSLNGEKAVCADWRLMPLASSTIDLALGDGSLSSLSYPDGYAAAFAELRRVLRPGARLILRCFTQPSRPETPDEILAELARGRVGSMHALKLSLCMAMQSTLETGISVYRVLDKLLEAWPDLTLLTRRFAWPAEEVA